MEDGTKIDKIRKFYEGNKGNHSDVRNYKVDKAYRIRIASERSAFKKDGAKMDNIWDLWHGTATSNVLSIMKQGLIIPPASSSHCTARVYGNGIYGSDNSSKALRYATA